MTTPLPLRLRALSGTAGLLMKCRLLPAPLAVLGTPHDERLKRRPLSVACKPGDPTIRTRDVLVEGHGGPIAARIYARPDAQAGAPGFLFIHGGGFVDGGVDFCDNVQRELAAIGGFVVVGLSYRLAPEHPFPAGLEDCQDVLRWMAETRPAGMSPDRIAVGGESAGANLTVALGLWSRDAAGPRISHLSVFYPFTDTTLASPDLDTMDMPGVGRAEAELMVKLYAGEQRQHPLVDVLHADHRGLPPSLVVTCGHDPLRTEGIWLAEAFTRAGVDTVHVHHADMPHGYLMFSRLTRRARESIQQMSDEARKRW